MASSSRTFCLAEDRLPDEVGLRLTLLTLRDFSPEAPVVVFRHAPSEAFRAFTRDFPLVTLIPHRPEGADSWNCKPHALLAVLDGGATEVVWLDSDLALARSCDHVFKDLGAEAMVVAEEMRSSNRPQGSLLRTQGWGLIPGRAFPVTINSCVLRVTHWHRPLLLRWKELLADDRYQAAQREPIAQRPVAFQGDQDVLNALLGSQEFAGVPVRFLKRGRDIIHTSGSTRSYSVRERLGALFGQRIPPFLHNPGSKAWHALDPAQPNRYHFAERLFLETSPYVTLARKYAERLGPGQDWLHQRTPLGTILRGLGFGHYALRGLPAAAALTLLIKLRDRLRRHRPRRTALHGTAYDE